jgi:hypothetical protein
MRSSKINNLYFYTVLALLGATVFYFNQFHLNQDYIYYNHILPIAENLLKGLGYTGFGQREVFYPMWGYVFLQLPGVTFGFPEAWTLILQYFLAILGIMVFYKLFELQKKFSHLLLFIPYLALCSLKTPDGIVATLLIFYLYNLKLLNERKQLKFLIFAGLIIGAIVNTRTEYIYLPLFQLSIFIFFKKDKIISLKNYLVISSIMVISLFPWAIRSETTTGEWRLTSSNGGAVAYISLGQLPNNAWRILPTDSTAYQIAKNYGIKDPFSPEADKIFKELTFKAISEHPLEFAKKMAFNSTNFFTGGVYTGEYGNFFIGKKERTKIDEKINKESNKINQFLALLRLESYASIPILIEKSIQLLFLIFFLWITLNSFVSYTKILINKKFVDDLQFNLFIILLYKILLIAAIQYEYRHTTGVYLIILGMFLYFQEKSQLNK